jgi:hypothetical protein
MSDTQAGLPALVEKIAFANYVSDPYHHICFGKQNSDLLNILQLPLLSRATSDSPEPTPGYTFHEIESIL